MSWSSGVAQFEGLKEEKNLAFLVLERGTISQDVKEWKDFRTNRWLVQVERQQLFIGGIYIWEKPEQELVLIIHER